MTRFPVIKRCFRYLAGDDDEIEATDEDHDDKDEDPEETGDEDNATEFDAQLFKEQVIKIQQTAVSRFSALPHRNTRLFNRSEKRNQQT